MRIVLISSAQETVTSNPPGHGGLSLIIDAFMVTGCTVSALGFSAIPDWDELETRVKDSSYDAVIFYGWIDQFNWAVITARKFPKLTIHFVGGAFMHDQAESDRRLLSLHEIPLQQDRQDDLYQSIADLVKKIKNPPPE